MIQRGGEHLMSLIEGTLDIARIESGKLTLEKKPMRFADTVGAVAHLFELQAAEKGLGFQLDSGAGLPPVVRGDEQRLRQILINLLGNAIKFTSAGQVRLSVHYQGEIATFEVADTGPGMTPEELQRVFEPFARARSASDAAPGAGLGLTIAGMLASLMGGELVAESTPGRGSRFRLKLFLPRLPDDALPPPASAPGARYAGGHLGRRRRVLTVDNEEADRQLIAQWLEPLGFDVREAANGHEALALLHAGYRPDVVLMDLAMPGIDGWETLRRIGALRLPGLHCAVVSSNAFDRGLPNDVGIGAGDYFIKPVRRSDLLDWLTRRLGLEWAPPAATQDESSDRPPALSAPAQAAITNAAQTTGGAPGSAPLPPPEALQPLQHAVALGYYRGVLKAADALAQADPGLGRAGRARARTGRTIPLRRDRRADRPGRHRCRCGRRRAAAHAPAMNAAANDPPTVVPAALAPLPDDELLGRADSDVVLIVDDMPDNLAVLHDALDESGHTVLVATSGAQALQRAAQAHPDIVLLDALMPGMDGFEVARRLKADPATAAIPIIFMTGLTETEHLVAGLEAGGVDYVTKPVKVRELIARIGVHLGGARRARRQARQASQARNALDAFGYASVTVRAADGRLLWTTALARELLQQYFGADAASAAAVLPDPVAQWLRRSLPAPGQPLPPDPPRYAVDQGARRLSFSLHQQVGDSEGGGDWLLVMREVSDAAVIESLAQAFRLTAREAEVLYWVVKGKINRDIGDILGASPATVKKHLERIFAKLGVETRTAAAAMALQRLRPLHPQFEG